MSYNIGDFIDLTHINTNVSGNSVMRPKRSKNTIGKVFASIQVTDEQYLFKPVFPKLAIAF